MADEQHGIEIGIDSRPAETGKERVIRSLDDIKRKTESLGPSTKRASESYREWSQRMDAAAAKSGRTMDSLRDKARRAGNEGADATARFQAALDRLTASANRFNSASSKVSGRPFEDANRSASRLNTTLSTMRGLIIGLGAVEATKAIIGTDQAFKGFNQSLKIVSGSQAGANREMQFVETTAKNLGLRVRDLSASWVGMAAATRGTNLEGERSREIFTAITKAGVAYGLSNDNIRGSLLAVQQMMNKGQVQAEELRGQLGERLPGAFQIAARSMGKTTQELSKMLEMGQVVAADFLPKFAAQLQKELPDGLKSVNAGFNEFLDQLDQAMIAISRSGFFDGIAAGATALAKSLQEMAGNGTLSTLGSAIGGIIKLLADNIDLLQTAALAYGAYFAAMKVNLLVTFVAELVALERALGASNLAMALFGVTSKGVQGILTTLLSTTALLTAGITAVIGALIAFNSHGNKMQTISSGMTKVLSDTAQGLHDTANKITGANTELSTMAGQASATTVQVNSFAGAVGNAAQQLYNLAKARQKAALSELMEKKAKLGGDISVLQGQTAAGTAARDRSLNQSVVDTARNDPMKLPGAIWNAMKGQWDTTRADVSREFGFGPDEKQLQKSISEGQRAMAGLDKQIQLTKEHMEMFVDEQEKANATTVAGTKPTLAMANALAKQEAASTELQKAQAGLAVTRAQAAADLKSGAITMEQYAARVGDAMRAVDNAKAATKGHSKALAEQKRMMNEAEQSANKLSSIMARWDEQPRFLDQSAKDIKVLDDMVGKWIEVGDAVIRYTKEMRNADVSKIQKGMQKPFEDVIQSSRDELTVLQLILDGREVEAEALDRRLQYERQYGKMLPDQWKQLLGQVQAHQLINEELKKRQRITNIYLDAVADVQSAFEKMLGTFAKNPLKSLKDFFKDASNSFKTMFTRLISESVFGGIEKEIRDLVSGNTGVQAASDVLVGEIQKTQGSVTVLSDAMIDAANEISQAAARASGSLMPSAANDNAVADVADIIVTGQKNKDNANKTKSTSDLVMEKTVSKLVGGVGKSLKTVWNVMPKPMQQVLSKVGGTIESGLNKLGIKLPKGLEDISGKITKGLKGAGEGMMASGIVRSLGIKQSATGAGIGGAIGGLTGIPGMSIVGGLVGGTLGGMLKKTKWGAANITSATGDATITGNSNSAKTNAGGAATSIQGGLQDIANQLGGTASGGFNITIGQRHGDWRVREGAGSLKVKKGAKEFDDDYEGALAYAIQLAVKQGAIEGISDASKRVLTRSSDTSTAISAAATYEDLLRQAAKLKDPIKGTFDELNRSINQMTSSLKAAGYSAEDLKAVEAVFEQQRKDALESMTSGYKDFIEEITNGPDSGKTIWQQFTDAQQKFANVKAGVAAGTATQEDFTNAGQNLFDLARQVYGSATPEFEAIKAQLVEATQNALTQVQQASGITAQDVATVATAVTTSAAAAEAQRDQQTQYLAEIAANLRNLPVNENGSSGYYAGSGGGSGRAIDGRYVQAY